MTIYIKTNDEAIIFGSNKVSKSSNYMVLLKNTDKIGLHKI